MPVSFIRWFITLFLTKNYSILHKTTRKPWKEVWLCICHKWRVGDDPWRAESPSVYVKTLSQGICIMLFRRWNFYLIWFHLELFSWSDQGAFTGEMIPVTLKFYGIGRRWFSGKKINKDYSTRNIPHLFHTDGKWRRDDDTSSEDEFNDDDKSFEIEKLTIWAS